MNDNVIKMGPKLEIWTTVYEKPEFKVQVSSHLRLLFSNNKDKNSTQIFSLTEAMKLLMNIKKGYDAFGTVPGTNVKLPIKSL